MASNLAKAGFCLVSGMAMGIDTIVHRAALDARGATVAVLGSGVDCPYPRCNQGIYENIIKNNGAVISEYENGTTPFKSHFPARNRIIAGLSLAVIVTEADAKSGSLITANFALQQNRTVMAVPGNITSLKSAGPNNLIKNGASAVTDYSDVLAILGLESPNMVKHKPKADSREEAKIIELLSEQALSTEQLISKTGLDAINIASVISLMEITGKIRNLGAGLWITT
jgi:DNA processing protein